MLKLAKPVLSNRAILKSVFVDWLLKVKQKDKKKLLAMCLIYIPTFFSSKSANEEIKFFMEQK